MNVEELVWIVGSLALDDGAAIQRRRGRRAVAAARDISALLASRFRDEPPYVSLWEQFQAEPAETVAEFAGALDVMVEADPSLALRVQALLDEYYRDSGSSMPTEDQEEVSLDYQGLDRSGTYSETGVYLYGNVSPGGPMVGEDEDEGSVRTTAAAPDVAEVVALFSQLLELVDKHAATSPDIKRSVQAELRGLAEDTAVGSGMLQASMIERLCAIQRLSPELHRLIIGILSGPNADALPVLQDVASRMVSGQIRGYLSEGDAR